MKKVKVTPGLKKKKAKKETSESEAKAEALRESNRRAGRACLATYGRKFYQEIARKRHAKKKSQPQD